MNNDPKTPITAEQLSASEVVQQRLVRLWRSREKTLLSAEMMEVPERLKRELKALGDAYGQCAEELERPPIELLDALGIEANEPVEGREGDASEPN